MVGTVLVSGLLVNEFQEEWREKLLGLTGLFVNSPLLDFGEKGAQRNPQNKVFQIRAQFNTSIPLTRVLYGDKPLKQSEPVSSSAEWKW